MRVGGQLHLSAALPPGKRPVAYCIGGWVWTGAEKLTPTGIRSPDRSARSGSLYRLRYRTMSQTMDSAHNNMVNVELLSQSFAESGNMLY
jgi:hypothetical protein